jgi:ORF6N domain-containing protein
LLFIINYFEYAQNLTCGYLEIVQLSLIQNKIYEIRGMNVMLDFDLAEMYSVETKVLKQSVKRNQNRFPPDFMFALNQKEFQRLRSQIVTSKRGGRRYLPLAFTEQGVAMLSSILKSEKAILVNIIIVRTFVLLRQYTINYKDLQVQIKKLEKKHNKNFKKIFEALEYLFQVKVKEEDFRNRKRIGFKTD